MTSATRTPGPWSIGPMEEYEGISITARCVTVCQATYLGPWDEARTLANAAFIVEACNNYERVLAENKALRKSAKIGETLLRDRTEKQRRRARATGSVDDADRLSELEEALSVVTASINMGAAP